MLARAPQAQAAVLLLCAPLCDLCNTPGKIGFGRWNIAAESW